MDWGKAVWEVINAKSDFMHTFGGFQLEGCLL